MGSGVQQLKENLEESVSALKEKSSEFERCKRSLKKCMTWLGKGIRLVKEKDAQIAISDKQFQQTLTQITRQNFYIRFKWAFSLAELVYKQNQRKGIGDIITQNHERRLKIISFRQIQRNAPIQKELRRIKAIQDFTLKQKYFDLFKYFSSITREERYNWAKAGRFYEFLCKRRGLYAIRDFYDKNYVPHEVEDQQMEKAGNLHRFKFMQSIFLKFYVVINQQKIERLNDLKADSFYTKKRLQMLVKGIYNSRKIYKDYLKECEEVIKSKYQENLKIMAFSALLWQRNCARDHKVQMEGLFEKEKFFRTNRFFKLWQKAIENKQRLKALEAQCAAKHDLAIQRKYFIQYLKAYRKRRLQKKIYFVQWKTQCCNFRKQEGRILKMQSFEIRRSKQMKKDIFSILKAIYYRSKSSRHFREQESLRRCLKTDLEEKSKLKKRVNDLILENKEKQIKLKELEKADKLRLEAIYMQEKKLIREGKNISILKEQNHKLNKSILMLQKPKDEEIELRNENEMLKRKLVKFENQLLKFQTPKMGEIPQLEEIDRCLSRVSNIYSKASIDSDRDYQSQRDEHLESLEKELAIMRAKEKAYLATQSAFEQKMQSLEDKFKTEAENTRGLSRDLAYANRQIESLKNELLQTELDATNAETRSYINY